MSGRRSGGSEGGKREEKRDLRGTRSYGGAFNMIDVPLPIERIGAVK